MSQNFQAYRHNGDILCSLMSYIIRQYVDDIHFKTNLSDKTADFHNSVNDKIHLSCSTHLCHLSTTT